MEVMSLSHCLCLHILVICHYVALKSPETEGDSANERCLYLFFLQHNHQMRLSLNVYIKTVSDNSLKTTDLTEAELCFQYVYRKLHLASCRGIGPKSYSIVYQGVLSSHSAEANTPATFNWPSGVVPYLIEPDYDDIIVARIRAAMNTIESSSCVLFKDVKVPPPREPAPIPWLVIQNPEGIRECTHSTLREQSATVLTKAILVLGYDCMQRRDILHALLHALGFNDEVTHPQRNMYIRIMWENIQPKYRSLFWMRTGGTPHKMVEYDSMSIMHFHNRAFSVNGGATILPLISDLRIAPSDKLSQLDVMKLRLAFGHECNKRKVGNLINTCQDVLKDGDNEQAEKSGENSESKRICDSGLHEFDKP